MLGRWGRCDIRGRQAGGRGRGGRARHTGGWLRHTACRDGHLHLSTFTSKGHAVTYTGSWPGPHTSPTARPGPREREPPLALHGRSMPSEQGAGIVWSPHTYGGARCELSPGRQARRQRSRKRSWRNPCTARSNVPRPSCCTGMSGSMTMDAMRRCSPLMARLVPGQRQLYLPGGSAGPRGALCPSPRRRPLPSRQRVLHSQGQPEASAPAPALPEAPASVNVRLAIGGADVQWTLRDQCEDQLAERLERRLHAFQVAKVQAIVAPDGGTPTATPTCPYHGAMRESTKAKGTFYCPSRMGNGTYCKERCPAK